MFTMYNGWGARLLRALVQLSLDRNADAYTEVRPPTLVRTETMVATGHLPKFADDAYQIERDDLWAIPTAEVPLTSLHRDEVLDEADLPRRYMAYTSCFRREAGSAGRDTRGLLRSHEFDKVELFALATGAEQAIACQEDVLARSERLLRDLGLAYRVVDLCTGDLGASAARTWDLEAYAPGCDLWLEVSSVSWFTDYQARRAGHPLPPTRWQGHRGVPHRERLGHGLASHDRRLPRDPPPARRLDRDRRGPAPLPRWRHRHHAVAADPCRSRDGSRTDPCTSRRESGQTRPFSSSHAVATSAGSSLSTSVATSHSMQVLGGDAGRSAR